MGMAAMQKPYLIGRGLIPANAKTDSIQILLKEALNFAVFIPFAALRSFLRSQFDHMLPVLYPPDRNDSAHVVRAYGKLNQVWRLQGALNLPTWDPPSAPETNTTGWVKFRENLPNNPTRRFYRILPP